MLVVETEKRIRPTKTLQAVVDEDTYAIAEYLAWDKNASTSSYWARVIRNHIAEAKLTRQDLERARDNFYRKFGHRPDEGDDDADEKTA